MPKPNRRFTPKEFEDELADAKAWFRPPRSFIRDTPFYPWAYPPPKPDICFDLNPQMYGI